MAVAATTDMMRVFLWIVTSSWATMVVNEDAVLSCPRDHRVLKRIKWRNGSYLDIGLGDERAREQEGDARKKGLHKKRLSQEQITKITSSDT
jgi:hypothetical protein